MATSEQERRIEMRLTIEKQLHEQYAINNNSNMTSVATLFTALVLVFGGYGYLFINSSVHFATDFSHLYCKCTETYSLDAFLFSAMATIIVTNIMKHICLYQGFQQRFEQFITFAIRYNYYTQDPTCLFPRIYPSYYTPFKKNEKNEEKERNNCEKTSCCKEPLVQGLFGELFCILNYLDYIIYASILLKLSFNCINSIGIPHGRGIFELWILIITIILTCSWICQKRKELRKKYRRLTLEYRYYLKTNNNKK